MIRNVLIASVALAALASPALATNRPCAEFELLGNDGEFVYNPFRPSAIERTLVLRVTRLDPSVTRVRFLLADVTPDGNFPRIGAFGVREYDIFPRDIGPNDGPLLVWGPQAVNPMNGRDVLFGQSRRNDQTEHLTLRVPAGQPTTAMDQRERLEVRYECYAGDDRLGQPRNQFDGRVRLVMDTRRVLGAYVGSEGRVRGEINLGSLDPSSGIVSKEAIVTTVSTVPYTVSIASSAAGELSSKTGGPGLPYRMTFDGLAVTNGSRLRCGASPAPNGSDHRLDVSVDGEDTRPLRAGNYRDTVTLTFAARDVVQSGPCLVTGA